MTQVNGFDSNVMEHCQHRIWSDVGRLHDDHADTAHVIYALHSNRTATTSPIQVTLPHRARSIEVSAELCPEWREGYMKCNIRALTLRA